MQYTDEQIKFVDWLIMQDSTSGSPLHNELFNSNLYCTKTQKTVYNIAWCVVNDSVLEKEEKELLNTFIRKNKAKLLQAKYPDVD